MKIIPNKYYPQVGDKVITNKFESCIYGDIEFIYAMEDFVGEIGIIEEIQLLDDIEDGEDGITYSHRVHNWWWPVEALKKVK